MSAGHNPAVFRAFDQSEPRELQGRDIPLGVDGRWQYTMFSEILASGVLLMGTDGIWDAMDAGQEMFGKKRLHAVLAENRHSNPQHIATEILREIGEFTGGVQADDDRTVVIARLG